MIKRVLILDNGLKNQTGHQFTMDLAFKREFEARGLACRVWAREQAMKDVLAALGAQPVFRSSPFTRFSKDPLAGPIQSAVRGGRRFAYDCNAVMAEEGVGPDDLLFLPFALINELDGIHRWLSTVAPVARPQVLLNIGFNNSTQGNDGTPNVLTLATLRLIGTRLARDFEEPGLILTTCGAAPAHTLSDVLTYPVHEYPLALDYASRPAPSFDPAPREGPITVSVFGHSQGEKGFHLLPEIFRICRGEMPELRFFIQVDPPKAIDLWDDAEALTSSDRVTLHHGSLDSDDYFDRLEASDILLLPYDPRFYRDRTSGVFTEGLAFGKVCVVLHGGWMSEQLEAQRGVGGAFKEFSAASVARVLLTVARKFDQLRRNAAPLIEPWRARHNTVNFVDRLLTDIARDPAAATAPQRSAD